MSHVYPAHQAAVVDTEEKKQLLHAAGGKALASEVQHAVHYIRGLHVEYTHVTYTHAYEYRWGG